MNTFEKSYLLPYPLPEVYRHWVSNDTVIAPAERMEIDAAPGGVYRLIMPGGMTMEGRFNEVLPEQRLSYSWHWQGDEETSQVRVEFAAAGAGTQVTINHTGFTSQTSYDNHAQGWDSYIEGFSAYLATKA